MNEKMFQRFVELCPTLNGGVSHPKDDETWGELACELAPDMATEIVQLRIMVAREPQGICQWKLTDDEWNQWSGDCGTAWTLETDDPVTNGMNYCPRCGRKLEQLPAEREAE